MTNNNHNNNKIKILQAYKNNHKTKIILIHMCKSLCRGSLQSEKCEGHVHP